MKTNKFWSILVMLVVSVTAMVFTSCSSDDDGDGGSKDINAQEVFGTWTCTASTDKLDGQTITGYMVGQTITIKEDGKFTSTSSSIGNGTWVLMVIKLLPQTPLVTHSVQHLLLAATQ